MKVNLGCGNAYLEGWVNVDADPDVRADVYSDAFEFVREHGSECNEIYMGHFLEHLMPGAARDLLALMAVRLAPGTVISAVSADCERSSTPIAMTRSRTASSTRPTCTAMWKGAVTAGCTTSRL